MGGRGSPKAPTHTHKRYSKWLKVGLTHMASIGTWGHMPALIGAKFGS